MKTLAISLIEKIQNRDGGTFEHLKSLEVFLSKTEEKTILLQDIVQQKRVPVLLELQNQQLTTFLDCSGLSPYEIWYFDEKCQFSGKAYSLNQDSDASQIQTQAKWILCIHLASKEFDDLKNFTCSELELKDKYGIFKREFPHGYGVFPYFIIKHEKSPCFTQIPIQIFAEDTDLPNFDGMLIPIPSLDLDSDDKVLKILLEHFESIFENVNLNAAVPKKMALVLGEDSAYYINNLYEKPEESASIPSGGIVLSQQGQIIAKNTHHFIY